MKGHAMTTKTTTKKPAPKLTRFRVYFRTSKNPQPQHYDCEAEDVNAAHTAVRLHHVGEDVRVFIDKVKVRRSV